uniref:Acyl-CoA thioesterase II n=1 Tax=Rhabditophanes sp. KR3021 TaxID=114890 RepID=A0AC35U0P1_9BILA
MTSTLVITFPLNGDCYKQIEQLHETTDKDVFVAYIVHANVEKKSVYGGQLMAQSIIAASKTINDIFHCYSFHMNFIGGVVPTKPIYFKVNRTMDGPKFSNRMVRVYHEATLLCECSIAFRIDNEKAIFNAHSFPKVPKPHQLDDEYPTVLRFLQNKNLTAIQRNFLEFADKRIDNFTIKRPCYPEIYLLVDRQTTVENHYCWIKPRFTIPSSQTDQKAYIAYISDYCPMETAVKNHLSNGYVCDYAASLNHLIYFHKSDINVNDWLLYESSSPIADNGRALTMGRFWSQDGQLIATIAQECLTRSRTAVSKL